MVAKKAKKKVGSSTEKRRLTRTPELPTAPIAQAPPAPKANPLRQQLVTWLLLGGVLVYYFAPSCKREAASTGAPEAAVSAASTAAPAPAWGPKVSLKEVSHFTAQAGVMDIEADATGNVYTLTGNEIRLYVDGKLKKSQGLDSGPNRSLAMNGQLLMVTNSDNSSVILLDKALEPKGTFKVDASKRLLGAVSRGSQGWVISEVDGSLLHYVDANGKNQSAKKGLVPGGNGFVYDLAFDPSGRLHGNNTYDGTVVRLEKNKPVTAFTSPSAMGQNYRLAFLGDKAYIGCVREGEVVVVNLEGKPLGHAKLEVPTLVTAGLDGFLYLASGEKIYKIKPM